MKIINFSERLYARLYIIKNIDICVLFIMVLIGPGKINII